MVHTGQEETVIITEVRTAEVLQGGDLLCQVTIHARQTNHNLSASGRGYSWSEARGKALKKIQEQLEEIELWGPIAHLPEPTEEDVGGEES
jgi:hypothetical protein